MKIQYLLIFIIFFFVSCKNEKITKYPNGNILEKAELNDKGQIHGKKISYYQSGKVESEAMYKNDTLNGFYTDYYENGNKKIECYHKNGNTDGFEKSYYVTGQINALIEYKNGYRNGNVLYYFTDGSIKAKAFSKQGIYLYYTKYDSLGTVIDKNHFIQIYILNKNKISKHDSVKIKAKIYNFVNTENKPIHSFFYKITSDGANGEYMSLNKNDSCYYHTFKPANDTGKFCISITFLLEGRFSNEVDSIITIGD